MKRAGGLFEQIIEPDNLRAAFQKAAKGKAGRKEVKDFREHLDENISALHSQLVGRSLDIGHYRFFHVRDPKKRLICAASFPERVLHHAIMNICEPILDRYAIFDSYACRKGKGTKRAVERAQRFSRRHAWYLKLDIRKYFDSIDHGILMGLLKGRIKDKDTLFLFETILSTYRTAPGKGLPIGNLVSQHLANFYLSGFDRWIKEDLRISSYLRYMDDFVLFGDDKEEMKSALIQVRRFLCEKRSLALKPEIQINQCRKGIPFLGYRVYPHTIRLSLQSRKRFVAKLRRHEGMWLNEKISETDLARHVEPLTAFTKIADAKTFRRSVMERYGVSP